MKNFAKSVILKIPKAVIKDSITTVFLKNLTSTMKNEALVACILTLKRNDPHADVSALEAEIDRHVYQLYELTEEEIAIVEGRVTLGLKSA